MFHEKLVHKVREIQSAQEITEGTSMEAWKVVWNKNSFARKYRTLSLVRPPPTHMPPRPL